MPSILAATPAAELADLNAVFGAATSHTHTTRHPGGDITIHFTEAADVSGPDDDETWAQAVGTAKRVLRQRGRNI